MELVIGIVSSIVTSVADYTIAPIINQIKYLSNHDKNVQSLKYQVESLKHARERLQHSVDAAIGNGEEIEHDVDKWLTTVNKKIDEEEEKVMQYEEKAKKAKKKNFLGLCSCFWTRYKLSMRAEEEAKAVAELLERGKFERVSYRAAPQPPTSVAGFEAFESRTQVLNGIMEALKDASIKVIGVHGMSGVGKTMLVKEVSRQVLEAQLFDSVVKATVTQTVDVNKIQNQIADSLRLNFAEQSKEGRADRLRERLNKEKKILVVLDDIWARLDLEEVGIPVGNEREGCKILLASRDLNVLSSGMDTQKNFEVRLLNEAEAWVLFKKMAGDCVKSCDLQPIAIEVAKKCARLPMAIAAVARALRNRSLFAWEDALHELRRPSSGNFAGVPEDVYSAIKLSYNYLESEEVKLTFLHCSLMGHNALIQDLLKYIIGLGIFQGVHTIKEARDKVLTVVSQLKESSLLLDSYNNERFDIHDVVLGVALSIASRDHHMFVVRHGEEEWPDKERMNNCYAIDLHYPRFMTALPDEMQWSDLSFSHMAYDGSVKIPASFFRRTERLKVLDFTGMHFLSLPVSINLLTSLHTLCLHQCALEDISIIGKIKSLKILSFRHSNIEVLAMEIAQLTRLRWLDLSHCTELKIIPPDVLSNLSNLEELYMENSFVRWEEEVPGSERRNASLEELKHLTRLTTFFAHIPNAQIIPERLFIKTLDRYRIFIGDYHARVWSDDYEYSRTLKVKLDTSICKDHGVKISLQNTEDLYLDQLEGIKNVLDELNNGEDFPDLKKLHIENGLEVQYIATEKMEFGKLQSMTLQDLPQLVSFSSEGRRCSTSHQEQEDTSIKPLFNYQIAFPELKNPQLSSTKTQRIWHNQPSDTCFSFPNLKSLIIQGCGNLKHLLLPSVARSLVQHQHFEIAKCKCLREIIVTEEIEEGKKDVIRFPQLNSLKIRDLENLIKFCSGNYDIEFPSLKELNIENCPKLKEFVNETKMEGNYQYGVPALFNRKVAVPCLQRMKISHLRNVKMIFHNELLAGSFGKLEEMVVQFCHQLWTIFSSTTIRVFHCLEKLSVCNCDSLEQIFELGGLNIEDTLGVEYSQLRELSIFSLSALKHVWNNYSLGIPNFKNLRRVSAQDCWSLKSLFPVSIAKDLPQLEYLKIFSCGVEEIASAGERLEQPIRFDFPRVSFLWVINLNKLKCFYPGQHTIVWLNLKTILTTDCSTLLKIVALERLIGNQEMNGNGQRDSTIPQQHFLLEKVTPKLEELRFQKLDEIAMMCDGQFPVDLFHQMKVFEVGGSANFPISFLQRLYDLENLGFRDCNFKNLTCYGGDVGEKPDAGTVLSRVKMLKLTCCKNVTHIWKKDSELGHIILPNLETLEVFWCDDLINFGSSSSSFQNLTTLQVNGCKKMINLVTPSVAQNLLHLKEMTMASCYRMTEIVANSEGDDEATYEITFRKLKYLKLHRLRNLASFCSGNHTLKFPFLEELIVIECPSLKIVCQGVLSTPRLQRVKESDDHDSERWAGDLNTTIQLLHTQKGISTPGPEYLFHLSELEALPKSPAKGVKSKVGFRGLYHLTLSDEFRWLMKMWNTNPGELLDLKNLQCIEVCNCGSLKYIFTPSMASSLKRLRRLVVQECSTMEQVIGEKGVEEEVTADKFTFPQLHSIEIKSCSNFTCFYLGSRALEFPWLKIIRIAECPKLTTFASSFSRNKEKESIDNGSEGRLNIAPTFFNDKVVCPKLNCLELSSINIKKIWDLQQPSSSPYAQNLEELTIKGCHNLKYLFPSLMVKHFLQLQRLDIWDCKIMEEVIFFIEGLTEEERMSPILFPKLEFLKLKDLPKLTRFCYETHNEFPLLKSLNLINCPVLKTFISKSVIEDVEDVGDESQIDKKTEGNNLEVDNSVLFNEKDKFEAAFCNLRILEVEECCKFKTLVPSLASFENLTTLEVSRCHGIFNLIACSGAKSQMLLERLSVTECKMIEEIIACEGEEIKGGIVFTKLKYLQLSCLPSLVSFSLGDHNFEFPAMEELIVRECPKMKNFCQGDLSTPKLERVQLTEDEDKKRGRWDGNLKTTIHQLFKEMINPHARGLKNKHFPYFNDFVKIFYKDKDIKARVERRADVAESFNASDDTDFGYNENEIGIDQDEKRLDEDKVESSACATTLTTSRTLSGMKRSRSYDGLVELVE